MTWLAERIVKLLGWEVTGSIPDVPKLIIIGAPHTTNWDFVLYLAVVRHFRLHASFIGKHTLFRWPFGYLFRRLGGIPVDRSKPGGLVQQVVDAIDRSERMVLAMAPEGTRKPAPYWKSGFLHIAAQAGVPILLAYVDYPRKKVGMGPMLTFDGDIPGFMDACRAFYADKEGRHPEGKGPVTVREELSSG